MSGVDYIIVQAGGKGTRLEHLTRNKPKAIVSIDRLPMIFHLFRKYPDVRFIIVADYKKDVLEKYLETFAEAKYIVVGTDGNTGTCSGIRNALSYVPDKTKFMLIWSDLILDSKIYLSEEGRNEGINLIGLSDTFQCRWQYRNGELSEEPSDEYGVAGLFVFNEKQIINDVPSSGEFVRWLQTQDIKFDPIYLGDTKEYGTLDTICEPVNCCRPFNKITVSDGLLKKEGIDNQGKNLAIREKSWYKHVEMYDDISIPKIHSYDPLIMNEIDGKNVFEYDFPEDEKKEVLNYIIESLKNLHNHEEFPSDKFSIMNAYYGKTMERLDRVRNLIPHSNEEYITVNGKKCRNVFFFRDKLRDKIKSINCDRFKLIHGDCTFSNIVLDKNKQPYLIDPRGYFGYTELHGDLMYDWAKLYYSLVGNYDQFNLGNFKLEINDEIWLNIQSNGWESLEEYFFELISEETDVKTLKFIHAIIWLSLTTYAWNDYDSVCGAFYNGLYYLEDVL